MKVPPGSVMSFTLKSCLHGKGRRSLKLPTRRTRPADQRGTRHGRPTAAAVTHTHVDPLKAASGVGAGWWVFAGNGAYAKRRVFADPTRLRTGEWHWQCLDWRVHLDLAAAALGDASLSRAMCRIM